MSCFSLPPLSALPALPLNHAALKQTISTSDETLVPGTSVHTASDTAKNQLQLAVAFFTFNGSTDCCSERESPTRPRSSPLLLDPQASPAPAPAHSAHFLYVAQHPSALQAHMLIYSPRPDSSPTAQPRIFIDGLSTVCEEKLTHCFAR